ncbi:DUF4360 domain-containing protein [Bdellovibrio bacteriovorus]|uniref:Putative secreted protein n=1 Tax=Bdellovibrio bacteriovorus str. Tiberius TaxID=1069642 RepID=K7ZBN5_BDEBC|nr:DUF4360 domain-containing protein [Bdellovibrio bacteriovorus]AFY02474.1 putative secreted protein [Bdellovibrio bacteriovorus str. Tiberius]
MKGKLLIAIAGMISAMSLQANAQEIRLGQPAYGGTGCPAGSASVTVSPDASALSILFDNYVAEAGSGRSMDRKSCNISVPVTVPSGYSVAVIQVDYRGFNFVPRGGMSRFDAEYFWAGARGPRISRTFMGPVNDSYTISDGLIASTMVWTPCGANVNLRVNTSMMAKSNARGEQTLATVDSADISSGLIYHLQWRRCR